MLRTESLNEYAEFTLDGASYTIYKWYACTQGQSRGNNVPRRNRTFKDRIIEIKVVYLGGIEVHVHGILRLFYLKYL